VPEFAVNPTRFDPYKSFKFRVSWDGRQVPGVARVGGLRWSLAPERGGAALALPGGGALPAGITVRPPTLEQLLDPLGLFGGGGLLGIFGGGEPGEEGGQPPVDLRPRYAPVRLERGRTHDASFETWAEAVAGGDGEKGSGGTKDVLVGLLNEAGQVALSFALRDCLPIEYETLGALDAGGDEVAWERLTLAYARCERDTSVQEPAEPSFG
jgi:phage tail-like protein